MGARSGTVGERELQGFLTIPAMGPDRDPASSRVDRWGAINTISRIRCGHASRLKAVLWFGEHFGAYSKTLGHKRLVEMRVIALARWTLLPHPERPRFLMFETNWSGAEESYIPDFAMIMPSQWNAIWGNTRRFPGPLPATRLLEHVREVDWGTDHFWSDYHAGASTQTVKAALDVRDELEGFIDRTRGLAPDRFATKWREFLTDVQHLI